MRPFEIAVVDAEDVLFPVFTENDAVPADEVRARILAGGFEGVVAGLGRELDLADSLFEFAAVDVAGADDGVGVGAAEEDGEVGEFGGFGVEAGVLAVAFDVVEGGGGGCVGGGLAGGGGDGVRVGDGGGGGEEVAFAVVAGDVGGLDPECLGGEGFGVGGRVEGRVGVGGEGCGVGVHGGLLAGGVPRGVFIWVLVSSHPADIPITTLISPCQIRLNAYM